jgi:hypothetical protein
MSVWKVLTIGVLACACIALATSTIYVPFTYTGGERWAWMGGLVGATLAAAGVFALFLKYAGRQLMARNR